MPAIRKVGIVAKPRREEVCAVLPALVSWLRERQIEVHFDKDTASFCGPSEKYMRREDLARVADLLIVLGGDGTILAAARMLHEREIPILPVNLGGMGFLTSVTREQMFPLLELALVGKNAFSARLMLEAELIRDGAVAERQRALNDAVIHQAELARLMDFDVHVDGALVGRYRADGLIIATPTGSTAYSLAAGGPIVHPALEAFVITPICPHAVTNRTLVIPDSARVEVEFKGGHDRMKLTLDGQVGFALRPMDRVAIVRSKSRVLLVVPPEKNYFEILRSKLHWGER